MAMSRTTPSDGPPHWLSSNSPTRSSTAFLEVLGYWLGGCHGTIQYQRDGCCSGVDFRQVKKIDLAWLQHTLAVAGLNGADYVHYKHKNTLQQLHITQPEWCFFFDAEFGGRCRSSKSAKWLPDWLMTELSAAEMQLLINGLYRAAGSFKGTGKSIFTSSAAFRDQLVQALLHCGYTTSSSFMYRAGTIRRYVHRSQSNLHKKHSVSVALFNRLSPTAQSTYRPIKALVDRWRVAWCDTTTKMGQLSCAPSLSRQQCIRSVPYSRERDGRTWCVNVDHDDHLIIAQRAVRDSHTGVVTKQSRPIITANCYMNSLMQQLYFTPPFRYGLFVQRHWDEMPRQATDTTSSVVYQMQLLMAQLQESVQRFYDARSFCHAYRDYEGACITGDHRVLTRSGWRSITAMQVGDVVLSFNRQHTRDGVEARTCSDVP